MWKPYANMYFLQHSQDPKYYVEMHLQFRSFFFTDQAGDAKYTMHKTFVKSAAFGDEVVVSESVKSLSSVNVVWSNKKKKQPSLGDVKNILNNDSLMMNKNNLMASCYKLPVCPSCVEKRHFPRKVAHANRSHGHCTLASRERNVLGAHEEEEFRRYGLCRRR